MIKKLFFISLLTFCEASYAQDPQFTQFYAAPLYLNPAFTGANVCSRVSTSYRNQWPSIPGAFVTYCASIDQSVPNFNSGVGLLFTNDKAGSGSLRSSSLSLLYAYEMQLSKEW